MVDWEDCLKLATQLPYTPQHISQQLQGERDLGKFTVADIKHILKHYRDKFHRNLRHTPEFLTLNGRKKELITMLQHTLAYDRDTAGQRSNHSNAQHSQYAAQQQAPPSVHAASHSHHYGVPAPGYPPPPSHAAVHAQHPGYGHPSQYQHPQYAPAHRGGGVQQHRAHQQQQPQQPQQQHVHESVGPPLSNDQAAALCKNECFMQARSPFYVINAVLDSVPIIINRKSRVAFVLSREVINALRSENYGNKQIHLRLFDSRTESHQAWNQVRVGVRVNEHFVHIDQRATNQGIKKKGHQIIQPLNITQNVASLIAGGRGNNMDSLKVTVDLFCQSPFNGIVVAELVRCRSTAEVLGDVITPEVENRLGTNRPRPPKVCEYCGIQDELLRCSRCKNTWYCGGAHQSEHWELHSFVCKPPRQHVVAKPVVHKDGDDELSVLDSRVCLRCPLSVGRIKIAAKGNKCNHPQCFDLQTFLEFCNMTGIWQCPICTQPLPFNELEIDVVMNRILQQITDPDVFQVRLLPNGEYAAISLDEEKAEENGGGGKPEKKRKMMDGSAKAATNGASSGSSSGSAANGAAANGDHGASTSSAIVLD